MAYVFFLGGRVMNVDEYKQVLSGCLDALVSANTALAEWGIHVTAFRMRPPCLDVAMPAASGFHSINITAPPGIPGNSGTEADGSIDSVDSVNRLLNEVLYLVAPASRTVTD